MYAINLCAIRKTHTLTKPVGSRTNRACVVPGILVGKVSVDMGRRRSACDDRTESIGGWRSDSAYAI